MGRVSVANDLGVREGCPHLVRRKLKFASQIEVSDNI